MYFFATSFYILISILLIQCINATIVPVFSDKKTGNIDVKLFNAVFTALILFSSFSVFAYYVTTSQVNIFNYIVPGFTAEQISLTLKFLDILFPSLILVVCVALFRGFLQSQSKFFETSISEIFLPVLSILLIYFVEDFGFIILVIPFVLSPLIQLIIQFNVMKSFFTKIKLNFDFDNKFKNLIHLMLPLIFAGVFTTVSKVFDQSLASTLDAGILSSLNMSIKINLLVMSLCIIPIITVLFPMFSSINENVVYKNNFHTNEEYNNLIIESFYKIILLSLPLSIYVYFNSLYIVELLFGFGKFNSDNVYITSECVKYFSLGLVLSALRLLLIKIYYSFKNTYVPTVFIIICSLINIFFNYMLVSKFSFYGIIYSTLIANLCLCLFLIVFFFVKSNCTIFTKFFLYRLFLIVVFVCLSFVFFSFLNMLLTTTMLFILSSFILSVYFLLLLYFNFFRPLLCLNQKFY
ncbi:hypothetical protein JK628_08200 [Shewanella sp. KX20019]|nr:hypothetical protein JK628_08200 [Shewanella sp. KX20019]